MQADGLRITHSIVDSWTRLHSFLSAALLKKTDGLIMQSRLQYACHCRTITLL